MKKGEGRQPFPLFYDYRRTLHAHVTPNSLFRSRFVARGGLERLRML